MKRLLMILALSVLTACNGGKKSEAAVMAERSVIITDSILTAPITDTIDMGRLHEGETVSQTVTLQNNASAPMIILSIKSSCGCTSVQHGNKPALRGETIPVTLKYDSKGFSGFQMKEITIRTSLSQNPYTIIMLADVVK